MSCQSSRVSVYTNQFWNLEPGTCQQHSAQICFWGLFSNKLTYSPHNSAVNSIPSGTSSFLAFAPPPARPCSCACPVQMLAPGMSPRLALLPLPPRPPSGSLSPGALWLPVSSPPGSARLAGLIQGCTPDRAPVVGRGDGPLPGFLCFAPFPLPPFAAE